MDYKEMPIRDQIAALPIIARTIGANLGVNVRMSTDAKTGSTDGKTIWLPAPAPSLSRPKASQYLDLVYGLEDHEAAHCRYTDFKLLSDVKATAKRLGIPLGVLHGLLNYFEDVWIEQMLPKEFPGTRKTLETMNEQMLPGPADATPEQLAPLDAILGYLAYRLYCKTQRLPKTERKLPGMKTAAMAVIGAQQLAELEVMSDAVLRASCTADNLKTATEVLCRLRQHATAAPQKGAKPEQSDGNSTGQDGNAAQPDTNHGQGKPGGKEKPEGQGASGGQGPANDAGQSGPEAGAGSPADKNQSAEQRARLAEQLADGSTEIKEASAERIRQVLEPNAVPQNMAGSGGMPTVTGRADRRTEVQRIADALTPRMTLELERALVSKTDVQEYASRTGIRLDQAKLAGTRTGNFEIFRNREEGEAVTSAVAICIDVSGSMSGKFTPAAAAVIAIGRAIYRVSQMLPDGSDGLEAGLVAFNGGAELLRPAAATWSSRDEDTVQYLDPTGGTNYGPMLDQAAAALAQSKKQRKIVLVVTDGVARDMVGIPAILRILTTLGIEVIFILIGASAGESARLTELCQDGALPKNRLVIVPEVTGLPAALVNALLQHV